MLNNPSPTPRRSSANPIPQRPRPTRQRSVSNVIVDSKSTTTTSWLNTLADGLNWIEVQSNHVVEQATSSGSTITGTGTGGGLGSGLGLGETLRGVGEVVQGGLRGRSLSSLGFGTSTPSVSENGDATGSESGVGDASSSFMLPPPVGSNGGAPNVSSSSTISTPVKKRPASFLGGMIKPRRPSTPTSSQSYNPGSGSNTPTTTNVTNATNTNTNTTLWDRASSPVHPIINTSIDTPTSTSSPLPNQGRPTVTRLGGPRPPSNLSRIRGSGSEGFVGPGSGSESGSGSGSALGSGSGSRSGNTMGRTGLGLVKSGSTGSVDRLGGNVSEGASNGTTTTTMGNGNMNVNVNGHGGPGRRRGSGWDSVAGSVGMERQSSSLSTNTTNTTTTTTTGAGGIGSRSATPGPLATTTTGTMGTITTHPSISTSPSHPHPLGSRTRSYKPGFQPLGVRSDRTESFQRARRKVAEERGREEGRLGKRWGKLIDLHFNPMAGSEVVHPGFPRTNTSTSTSSESRPLLPSLPSVNLNLSAALTNTLDGIKPKDVWRGFRSVTGVGLEQVEWEKKREVEKGLVRWEEDGEVRRCRICQSIFSLTNRKHHCRLCGRIVCSLAPTSQAILALTAPKPTLTPPIVPDTRNVNPRTGLPLGTRRETCSLLLVADYRTGRGQEVDENFVGWMQMGQRKTELADPSSGSGSESVSATSAARRPDEVQVKGVRACRECWQTVSRKQKMADRNQVDKFTRLYEALKSLEGEISETVPDYQDAMEEISHSVNPAGPIPIDVMNLHKHLITLFAEYDALTKRVRAYPCSPGSARERVQVAIARQASLFMAKEAGVLQLLPKIQKQRHKRATSSIMSGDSTPAGSETAIPMVPPASIVADDETALMLQPLLEQEAQLEAFIAEAKTQRKLEDAMTLQTSLEELRQEIARIASG